MFFIPFFFFLHLIKDEAKLNDEKDIYLYIKTIECHCILKVCTCMHLYLIETVNIYTYIYRDYVDIISTIFTLFDMTVYDSLSLLILKYFKFNTLR